MKKFTFTFLISFITLSTVMAQYWKSTGALAGSGSSTYLVGETHVGETIFVVSMENSLAYSTDNGKTWTKQTAAKPNGTYAALTGVSDRLYASMKINTYDFELFYSTNNGASWTIDTIGLPLSLTRTGKSGMILKDMGDGYVLAHNYSKAAYKKVGDANWKSTNIDFVIVDIAATSDRWLAIGQGKILQSTDNGGSWTAISASGLPAGFQGSLICSNGSRIFISNPAASGAQDIYFSDDGGSSWTLTNSAGKYTFANPWIKSLYAVDDYVFASVQPEFGKIQNPPPFIISSSAQPNFSVGDVSGLPTGRTNTNLPFFFHAGNKLFTMFWDLYSSEPGFTAGTPTAAQIDIKNEPSLLVYPNPASGEIHINVNNMDVTSVSFFDMTGREVLQITNTQRNSIAITDLKNGIYVVKADTNQGKSFYTRLVKN